MPPFPGTSQPLRAVLETLPGSPSPPYGRLLQLLRVALPTTLTGCGAAFPGSLRHPYGRLWQPFPAAATLTGRFGCPLLDSVHSPFGLFQLSLRATSASLSGCFRYPAKRSLFRTTFAVFHSFRSATQLALRRTTFIVLRGRHGPAFAPLQHLTWILRPLPSLSVFPLKALSGGRKPSRLAHAIPFGMRAQAHPTCNRKPFWGPRTQSPFSRRCEPYDLWPTALTGAAADRAVFAQNPFGSIKALSGPSKPF